MAEPSDVDSDYEDARLAALYDPLNQWAPSDDFYSEHIMAVASALDVGCGTGELLCHARAAGHSGSLVGVDPARAMLAIAGAKRADLEWLVGDAQTLDLGREFALITMTGHAFQVLLYDHATRSALYRFYQHLVPGGQLVFETRNPAARAWERWTPESSRSTVRSPTGEQFETFNDLAVARDPDLVDFVATFRSLSTGVTETSASTLRFIEPERLRGLLIEAGFRIDGWFGDWDRSEVTPTSPEIIVVATKA